MARPLRIEYPGAIYHVMNRGNQKNQVFFGDMHYELFLEKLCEFTEEYKVLIRCYCLMPNHFHLYMETPEGNLSRFMQSFLTSFSVKMNRLCKKSGHIFQGRFKSHLIDDEAYGMLLSRYIHLNPVRMNFFDNVPFRNKLRYLEEFKWSTYRGYAGLCELPDWIDAVPILSKFKSSSFNEKQHAYSNYVREGIRKGAENPFKSVTDQIILGRTKFAEKIKRRYILDLNLTNSKEQQTLARMKSSFAYDEVASIVSEIYGTPLNEIIKRRSKHREGKKFLAFCAVKYCRSSLPLVEIARCMGIGQSGLVRSKERFAIQMADNKKLLDKMRKFEQRLKSIAGV